VDAGASLAMDDESFVLAMAAFSGHFGFSSISIINVLISLRHLF
jgi:hypothetical protein